MSLLTRIKNRAKRQVAGLVQNELQAEVQAALDVQLPKWIEFYTSAVEDRQSFYDHTLDPLAGQEYFADLSRRLTACGLPVEEIQIDLDDFRAWMDEFVEIKTHYEAGGNQFIEKCLEHYLVYRYLELEQDDTYMDIGSDESPWADALANRGIGAYGLDMAYPDGVNGQHIGAEAQQTGLHDGFASVLSAQNAYQHFVGNADVDFVSEAARILDERGRFGIVPLYLDDTYYVATSPYFDQHTIEIDREAKRVWRDDGLKISFSRHYSPEVFCARVISALPSSMKGKMLYFGNLPEIMRNYPGQRIYCYFMFVCER